MSRIDLTQTRTATDDGTSSWVCASVMWTAAVLIGACLGWAATSGIDSIAAWQTMPAERIALGPRP